MIKCPYCWEEIKELAKKCKWCWEWLGKESKALHTWNNWKDSLFVKRNIIIFIWSLVLLIILYFIFSFFWKWLSTTYPWCNMPDIVIDSKDWRQVWSACNIWTNISWLWKESYWSYFKWWRNNISTKGYPLDLKYHNKDNNSWWDITNTSTARKWPCASWYHVPSKREWESAILIVLWKKELSNDYAGFKKFQETLKLPLAATLWWFYWRDWNYWSSTPDKYTDWNGEYSYVLGLTGERDMLHSNGLNWFVRRENSSVRCIKN